MGTQNRLALVTGTCACDHSPHLFHQGEGGREVTPFQLQESHSFHEFMPSGENSPKKSFRPQRRERFNATEPGPCRSCYLLMTVVPSVQVGPSDTGTQPSSSISRHGFPWACSPPKSPAIPSTYTLMCYCWHHPLSCRIEEIATFLWSYSRFSKHKLKPKSSPNPNQGKLSFITISLRMIPLENINYTEFAVLFFPAVLL